jgi:hypothetical protein
MNDPDLNQFNKAELKDYLENGEIPEWVEHEPKQDTVLSLFWLGSAASIMLVIFTWPILLIGMIAGIFSTLFLFCSTDD